MTYCPNPELFGSQFLSNVGVVEQKGSVLKFYEVTRPESQPAGANRKKSKKKQVEVVEIETERETRERIEAAWSTLHTQDEAALSSTSAAPEVSPGQASLVELVGHQDGWRSRMEGLVERRALNTKRIALHPEAQTRLLTSQTEIKRTYHVDVRTPVFAVREMVSLMANTLISQRKRAHHRAADSIRDLA